MATTHPTERPPAAEYPMRLGAGGGMRGRVVREDDVVTLALTGEFDLAGTEAFAAALAEIEATRPRAIVIDLDGLSFIDSTGITALVAAHQRAAGRWCLAVLSGSGPAHRTLSLVGLDECLLMLDSLSELPA